MRIVVFSLIILSTHLILEAQSPAIGGYNVYYGNLHNHTTVSDGTGTPDDAYNYAMNVGGMDYFSISDHVGGIEESEWVATKAAADKYNEDGVFTTFWGFEFSGNGHVTVINTDDYTTISDPPAGTFLELCTWLDARNGLAFFNHPARGSGIRFEGFASTPTDKIVGMELFNKSDDFSRYYYNDGFYPDDGGLNHFAEANSRGWRIGASGADDNHGGTWGTRNDFRMAILSEHLTRADLFAAMQARRFYSTLDKTLALSFKMDTSEMGSILEGGPYDMQILAKDGEGESFTKVMLYRNGFEFNTWEIDTADVNLTFPVNTFNGEFFYIKVTQADGDEAVSLPIFIKGGIFNEYPTCSISSPENGFHLEAPQTITISAEATDTDGLVASVEFYINGILVGSDTQAPFSIVYLIPATGSYEITAKVTDDAGSWTTSYPATFTVGVFAKTESSRIASGPDDVEENADGSMYTNSSDIELVDEGSNNNQTIGLRFTGLNIPPGAAIESASIQFTVDEVSTGSCVLSIKGDNADNSPSFSSAPRNVSDRVTTSAEVTWEPAEWPTIGAAGSDQRTPDLSSIIQEIVNRPGYTQSSAISIIITGTGERTAEAYEGVPGSAALLTVDYKFGMESAIKAPDLDETRINVFPNPVSEGKISIEIDTNITGSMSVSIADLTGRICYESRLRNNRTVVDVTGLKSGLYIITLTDHKKVISHKLMVE